MKVVKVVIRLLYPLVLARARAAFASWKVEFSGRERSCG